MAFCAAILSALGMGGGGILLVYLTAFAGVDQLKAQGINLVFFLPTAIAAVLLHLKNRLVKWRVALPVILTGLGGVWAGYELAGYIDQKLLSKAFSVFLLVVGIREWRIKPTDKEK